MVKTRAASAKENQQMPKIAVKKVAKKTIKKKAKKTIPVKAVQ